MAVQQLVDNLIKLSQLAHKKERAKQEGLKYIEIYRKTCTSCETSDIITLNSTLNQLDVDKSKIVLECTNILNKLLPEPISKYSFINRGILTEHEIEDGYVILCKKTMSAKELSKFLSMEFSSEIKLLILKGENAGKVLDCIEENNLRIADVM